MRVVCKRMRLFLWLCYTIAYSVVTMETECSYFRNGMWLLYYYGSQILILLKQGVNTDTMVTKCSCWLLWQQSVVTYTMVTKCGHYYWTGIERHKEVTVRSNDIWELIKAVMLGLASAIYSARVASYSVSDWCYSGLWTGIECQNDMGQFWLPVNCHSNKSSDVQGLCSRLVLVHFLKFSSGWTLKCS